MEEGDNDLGSEGADSGAAREESVAVDNRSTFVKLASRIFESTTVLKKSRAETMIRFVYHPDAYFLNM